MIAPNPEEYKSIPEIDWLTPAEVERGLVPAVGTKYNVLIGGKPMLVPANWYYSPINCAWGRRNDIAN